MIPDVTCGGVILAGFTFGAGRWRILLGVHTTSTCAGEDPWIYLGILLEIWFGDIVQTSQVTLKGFL